ENRCYLKLGDATELQKNQHSGPAEPSAPVSGYSVRAAAGKGAGRCARWLSHTLATTTAMPASCAGLRLWPSSPQPSKTAVTGLRKPSDDTTDGSSRARPRNQMT